MRRISIGLAVSAILLTGFTLAAETQTSTTTTTIQNDIIQPAPQTTTTTTTVKSETTTAPNEVDTAIMNAIYNKFAKESALIGTALTVTSANGIVTLQGTVTSQSQADQAILVAKSITGVKSVNSQINVKTNMGNPPTVNPNY